MGVKVSNDISSETTHQICSLPVIFMYTPGEEVVKRIVKFQILDFGAFSFFFFFLFFFFWGGLFNMVVNGE